MTKLPKQIIDTAVRDICKIPYTKSKTRIELQKALKDYGEWLLEQAKLNNFNPIKK